MLTHNQWRCYTGAALQVSGHDVWELQLDHSIVSATSLTYLTGHKHSADGLGYVLESCRGQ